MGTRMHGPTDGDRQDRVMVVKMPRRDYKRLFARDKDGNYIGTEPEKRWTETEVKREFDQYQDMPLRTIV